MTEPLTDEERVLEQIRPHWRSFWKRYGPTRNKRSSVIFSAGWMARDCEIAALESELQRLAGPVCEHDGKRAVEHELVITWRRSMPSPQTVRITRCAEIEAGRLCNCPPHPPAPLIEAWLRERSGR